MPRSKHAVRAYAHHRPTNQAYVRFAAAGGSSHGLPGEVQLPESVAEYNRIVAEVSDGQKPVD